MLSWKSVSGIESRVLRRWPKYVSNLVVMEVGQRPGLEDIWATVAMMFQTLLSWKSVSGSSAIANSAGQTEVSNLVVMEVGQRQWRVDSKRMDEFCFKPCCHGSRSAAVKGRDAKRDADVFQTLLSWKSVSGHRLDSSSNDSEFGFKPCCHGSRSAAGIDRLGIAGDLEFQTLLSWKSVSGADGLARGGRPVPVSNLVVMEVGQRPFRCRPARRRPCRFKPCCHGSRSAALRERDRQTEL